MHLANHLSRNYSKELNENSDNYAEIMASVNREEKFISDICLVDELAVS